MRKLNTGDVFAVARCLKTIGARDIIKRVAEEADTAEDLFGRGFLLVWELMEKASETQSEQAVYSVMARIIECDPAEVEQMPLEELTDYLKQIASENDLKAFFQSAAGMK